MSWGRSQEGRGRRGGERAAADTRPGGGEGRARGRADHAGFFLQAEDGIRDRNVTGVQTCALPIFDASDSESTSSAPGPPRTLTFWNGLGIVIGLQIGSGIFSAPATVMDKTQSAWLAVAVWFGAGRSEERRVGKEWRCRWGRAC